MKVLKTAFLKFLKSEEYIITVGIIIGILALIFFTAIILIYGMTVFKVVDIYRQWIWGG